jgi:hypothetical protein
MAEQSVHDVVNQNQSVGDLSPSDASASQTNHQLTRGREGGDQAADKNGFESQPQPSTGASEANRLKLGGDIVTNGLSHVCPSSACCLVRVTVLTFGAEITRHPRP